MLFMAYFLTLSLPTLFFSYFFAYSVFLLFLCLLCFSLISLPKSLSIRSKKKKKEVDSHVRLCP